MLDGDELAGSNTILEYAFLDLHRPVGRADQET